MSLQNAKVYFLKDSFNTSQRNQIRWILHSHKDAKEGLGFRQRIKIQTKALEISGRITLASGNFVSTLIKVF